MRKAKNLRELRDSMLAEADDSRGEHPDDPYFQGIANALTYAAVQLDRVLFTYPGPRPNDVGAE